VGIAQRSTTPSPRISVLGKIAFFSYPVPNSSWTAANREQGLLFGGNCLGLGNPSENLRRRPTSTK
jgi:hypothetical protein